MYFATGREVYFRASMFWIKIFAGGVDHDGDGRQPWTVYGLLRAADSVSPSLTGTDVLISLLGYIVAYLTMFPAGFLIMARMVRRGPIDSATGEGPVESGRPHLPVHALPAASGRSAP